MGNKYTRRDRPARFPVVTQAKCQFKLHHYVTAFIGLLCAAHLLWVYWIVKYEEIWTGLSPLQKAQKLARVLLIDSYLPRTQVDNSGSCPIVHHVPKVALLFVDDGAMPHQQAWRAWFTSAEGLVPISVVHGAERQLPSVTLCHRWLANSRANPISRQYLFSVYVHTPPAVKPFPRFHLFYKRQVPSTIEAQWGYHSLVEAVRLLLGTALADPSNARFQLVAGQTIPLFPPAVVYQQLMAQQRSHINACAPKSQIKVHPDWKDKVRGTGLSGSAWRKSSEFFTLTREHAELVANDTFLEPIFNSKLCRDPDKDNRPITCDSDEYYVATLLALREQGKATTCHGSALHDGWRLGQAGNRSRYSLQDTTAAGITQLRSNAGQCQTDQLLRAVQGEFQPVSALAAGGHFGGASRCPRPEAQPAAQGGSTGCFMFAGRFPPSTAQAVLRVLHDRTNPLRIIQDPADHDPQVSGIDKLDCMRGREAEEEARLQRLRLSSKRLRRAQLRKAALQRVGASGAGAAGGGAG